MASKVPDYLPQIVDELRKRGSPQKTIDGFCRHWNALPPARSDLPCPFCFAGGLEGRLREQTEVGGITAMRCDVCGEQLLVRTR